MMPPGKPERRQQDGIVDDAKCYPSCKPGYRTRLTPVEQNKGKREVKECACSPKDFIDQRQTQSYVPLYCSVLSSLLPGNAKRGKDDLNGANLRTWSTTPDALRSWSAAPNTLRAWCIGRNTSKGGDSCAKKHHGCHGRLHKLHHVDLPKRLCACMKICPKLGQFAYFR